MRKRCLVLVSGEGYVEVASFQGSVSAYSFIQAHSLLTRAHVDVIAASPGGKTPKFHCETDEEQAWLDQHRDLVFADASEAIAGDYDALCVPSGVGAVVDLGGSDRVGALAAAFAAAKKPVCVVGFGVLALSRAVSQGKWAYEGYNVTGSSNGELARLPYFSKLERLPEESVVDLGGLFCASQPDEVFVCVDRALISAQNPASTTLAVLNLVWLCNQS